MNSYERLFARLEGKPVDKAPNNCIVMGFGARYTGASYRDFVTDYRVLAEAAVRCHEDFRLDILSAISDPMREAEGFGSEIVFPEDGVPFAPKPFLENLSDIGKLKVYDPSSCRRTNDRLLAIRKMKEYAGKECAVQGWVEGALAEACDLRGINHLMMEMKTDPDAVMDLLEICVRQAIEFALAQVRAGADIIGIGDAAASLIGPAMYDEFALPYERRITEAVHGAGARTKLHICGNIGKLLMKVVETGADIIDCDWMVDFKSAVEAFGSRASACGNFDPVAVLLEGEPADVTAAVKECLSVSSPTSIIAAGCEVPPHTRPENLRAVAEALEL